jgi:hypothetical protein
MVKTLKKKLDALEKVHERFVAGDNVLHRLSLKFS